MPAKKSDVIVYVDNREAGSKVSSILKRRCKVESQNLPVGDYLLSRRVGVERKTAGDFVQSMMDGRLFRQLAELRENFTSPLMVIEGNIMENGRDVHPNSLRGALASVITDYSVPVIVTENQLETAELLLSIAKREQLDTKRSNNIRVQKRKRSMNEIQEFLVAGLPKINSSKAKALLKHFGTPEKLFTATEEELREVDGIGPGLSKQIRKILRSTYEKSILED